MTRSLIAALAAVDIALALVISWLVFWGDVNVAGSYFGGDHVAYREAATRLTSTGSPYHPAVITGPVGNHIDNVPIAYLYPPPLALLFVPLAGVDPHVIAWSWVVIQGLLLLILLPLVFRRFGGRLTVDSVALIWLATAVSLPVHMALYGGNVSGWLAILVTVMLLSGGVAGGLATAAAVALKMTPAVLFLPALAYRRTRLPALLGLTAIVALSFVLAPAAWMSWLTALPSIARFPTGDAGANFAPAAVLAPYGLGWLGALISYGIAAVSTVAAVILAWRGIWPAAVAAGVTALTFGTASTWDHYLVVLLPLGVAAAARGVWWVRAMVAAYVATSFVMWVGVADPPEPLRVLYLFVALATSIGLTVALSGRTFDDEASRAGSLARFTTSP